MDIIAKIEALSQRLDKAKALVKAGKVRPITGTDGDYAVESQTDGGKVYLVNDHCTCPDFQKRGEELGVCKHLLARMLVEQQGGDSKQHEYR